MIAQILSMVMGFISQRFFLRYLGLEVVGINSVITETLGFLSFAELGVGTAISFRLYKPLTQNDTNELAALMKLYRTLYQIIGIVVLVAGLGLSFMLPIFINDTSFDFKFIYCAYFVQLIATASTYFFAYKRSLIFVDQKQFVCKISDISCNIVFSIFRILILIFTCNYHLYLIVQLLQTLTSNIILSCYCNKNYPFVKVKMKERYHDIRGMFKDTKDVLLGRVAGYVYSSTDNLVISTFSGIVSAGGLSNYRYVTNSVKNLSYGITDSITATIGNSVQLRNKEDNYQMFQKYTFIRFVLANIMVTGICMCTEAFVGVFFGTEYIMHYSVLWLIAADIYIGVVYGPSGEFINVLGYFKYEKYINILGALINIGLSVLLVQFIGIQGVLIGTVISQVFFWISKSALLYWKYFESWKRYMNIWMDYLKYTILTIVQVWILHLLKQRWLFQRYDIVAFLLEGIGSVVASILLITIFFGRTKEYHYLITIVKQLCSRLMKFK